MVPEQLQQSVGRLDGLVDPAGLAGGLAQAGEGIGHRGVVGGVGQVAGLGGAIAVAGLPGAQPATVGLAQSVEQETAVLDGRLHPLLVAGGRGGFGQGGQHEAVPLQQHLVVQAGGNSQVAGRQEALSAQLHAGRAQQIAPHRAPQDVVALEVAGLGHAEPRP